MPCKVLIVEDQTLPRQWFEQAIAADDRFVLTASLDSARMADMWCARGEVDLILMDVVLKDGFSGLEAAERIRASYPRIKIIIVTSMPDEQVMQRARAIGVDSFWYKEAQTEPILAVMGRTMTGERVWPDIVPQATLGLVRREELTDREMDVLRLVAKGLSNSEIAEKLALKVSTVRFHVENLLSKTGFTSRTELAVNAVQSGITVPGVGAS